MSEVPVFQVSAASIRKASRDLASGQLVVFPTETVYGLGADATNESAVQSIFDAKGRPSVNPLICHIGDIEQLPLIAQVSDKALSLARLFWPGPLTLVLKQAEDCRVSRIATAALPTIAVRIPGHNAALELLRTFGGPVVAPSANTSGKISPTQADHVHLINPENVSMILDDGPCAIGLESTIVSLVEDKPILLRTGGVTKEELEEVIGSIQVDTATSATPSAPGQLESHYAPRATVRLNAKGADDGEAFLGFGPLGNIRSAHSLNLSPKGDLAEAATNLYAYLRALDETDCSTIAVAPIPNRGVGNAINDRLRRASAHRPTKGS